MNELITNGAEIKQRIILEINNAQQNIYLAMAYFTDRDIAMAIIEAKNRNVTVDIILSSNAQNETVKLMLKGAGINVHAFDTGDARGIMHHKFCLIDSKISINGSYNYSLNASNNNVENIQVSSDIASYSQFLSEFERLKYNIDNRIAVNEQSIIPETKIPETPATNIIDTFSKQLHSLVYSAAQIDTEKYKLEGYETSKESKGNLDIFRTEYNTIKERIRTYATDEGLGNMKNVLASKISIAYESTKINLDTEKQEKLEIAKRVNELEDKQTNLKLEQLKEQKLILESGNTNSGEKGLFQINKEIEKHKLEISNLEQGFIIKKFWSAGSILVSLALAIFVFYLSIFFASAVYKVFFEGNIIRTSIQKGLEPGIPPLIDANAIGKIFSQHGALFGFIAMLFFLIPVLLSNLKILGSENKKVNTIFFLVGLVVFDVIVSTMVALNSDLIQCLIEGKASTMQIWEVVLHGEFWLIFVFGMFPLFLTHFLVDSLIKNYNSSKREFVDGEKNRKLQLLEIEKIDFEADKNKIVVLLEVKNNEIDGTKNKLLKIETDLNNTITNIENKYSDLQRLIKAIYDDFSARITSGQLFTDVILNSAIAAYKSGFIEFLPEYYASDEVANRVKEIEHATFNQI
jgi:hypothetical protein